MTDLSIPARADLSGQGPAVSDLDFRADAGRDTPAADFGPSDLPDTGTGSALDLGDSITEAGLLVVALGHGRRTMVSCDRGRTWVADDYELDGVGDWGHHELTARELVASDGAFFAALGWGAPRRVLRSWDGVTWEAVIPTGEATDHWSGTANPSVVIFGQGNRGSRSIDGGDTWTPMMPPGRGKALFGASHSSLYMVNPGVERLVAWSGDEGKTWSSAALEGDLSLCFERTRGVAAVGERGLFVGVSGQTCMSEDDGRTWRRGTDVPGGGVDALVATSTQFWVFGSGGAHRSADGSNWQREGDAPELREVQALPGGGFVGLVAGQVFSSDDGVAWEAAQHAEQGPPIVHLAVGRGTRPDACDGG